MMIARWLEGEGISLQPTQPHGLRAKATYSGRMPNGSARVNLQVGPAWVSIVVPLKQGFTVRLDEASVVTFTNNGEDVSTRRQVFMVDAPRSVRFAHDRTRGLAQGDA